MKEEVQPASSYTAMLNMIANFQKTVLFYEVPTEIPLLLTQQSHPALWHAWMAASISFHSFPGSSDHWKRKELQHHTNAVASLREDIMANPHSQSEWRRAVVLMLYIYELLNNSGTSKQGICSMHLTAAHALFDPRSYRGIPSSQHELYIIEAYFMRTTKNALFHPEWKLPIDHVDGWLHILEHGTVQPQVLLRGHQYPWVGPISIVLIGYAYRLSWLAHAHCHDLQTDELTRILEDLQEIINAGVQDLRPAIATAQNEFTIRTVYAYSCAFLAAHLLERAGKKAGDGSRAYWKDGANAAFGIISSQSAFRTSTVLWPAIVLGAGATQNEEYDLILSLLGAGAGSSGPGPAGPVAVSLEEMWQLASEDRCAFSSAGVFANVLRSNNVFL